MPDQKKWVDRTFTSTWGGTYFSPLHPEKKLGDLTKDEMRALINSIPADADFHSGVQLLNLILDNGSSQDVVYFLEKGYGILRNSGMLLEFDFEGEAEEPETSPFVLPHGEKLHKVRPIPLRPSRVNLKEHGANAALSVGAVALGGFFGVDGLVTTGEQVQGYISPSAMEHRHEDKNAADQRFFGFLRKFIEDHLVGPFDLFLLGPIVIIEGKHHWEELKMKQISNMVSEFAQRIGAADVEHSPPAGSRKARRRS